MRFLLSSMMVFCLCEFAGGQSTLIRGNQKGSLEAAEAFYENQYRLEQVARAYRSSKKITYLDEIPERPRHYVQVLQLTELSKGTIGYLEHWQFYVMQVVGPKDMLLRTDNLSMPNIWLSDYPTKDFADDEKVRLIGLVRIGGTKQYTSIKGAPTTVRIVRLLNKAEIKDHAAAKAEAKAEAEAAEAEAKVKADTVAWQRRWDANKRTWKDKTGKFSVEAVYDAYLGEGKFRLLHKDKSEVVIHISELSKADQLTARELLRDTKK